MKQILMMFVVMCSLCSFSALAADKVQVDEVYDGWGDIDKIYVMTDTERNKYCYVVSNSQRVAMQCFDKVEEKK